MTHTPGPWRIDPVHRRFARLDITYYDNVYEDTVDVATAWNGSGMTNDEHRANANLIAAAPEMYEALKEWQSLRDDTELSTNDYLLRRDALQEDINNALAKAEGKQC